MITIKEATPEFKRCITCFKENTEINKISFIDANGNGQIVHICDECLKELEKAVDSRMYKLKQREIIKEFSLDMTPRLMKICCDFNFKELDDYRMIILLNPNFEGISFEGVNSKGLILEVEELKFKKSNFYALKFLEREKDILSRDWEEFKEKVASYF